AIRRHATARSWPRACTPSMACRSGTSVLALPALSVTCVVGPSTRRCAVDCLDVDDARIAYRVLGAGPPLLAPECNLTWSAIVETQLAQHFTLIVAAPRDYGPSTRSGGPGYDVERWATGLHAVTRHRGYARFLWFGYSFTGAFGPGL